VQTASISAKMQFVGFKLNMKSVSCYALEKFSRLEHICMGKQTLMKFIDHRILNKFGDVASSVEV
jgi:hypothetical protein